MEFVKNKRSIHIYDPNKPGQICGAWNNYGWRMPKATDDQVSHLALCKKCERIAKGRPGAPAIARKVLLYPNHIELIEEALGDFADKCGLFDDPEYKEIMDALKR